MDERAIRTYVMAEPFDRAVKLLRKVLEGANFKVTGELNLSDRIARALLIETAPCTVLFVCPDGGPQGPEQDPGGAMLTPIHIAVSARGAQTEVHILRVVPRDDGTLDHRTIVACARLQAAIAEAMGTIGMRATLAV